jgi:hypothetical protein
MRAALIEVAVRANPVRITAHEPVDANGDTVRRIVAVIIPATAIATLAALPIGCDAHSRRAGFEAVIAS